jgi:hypothetical protein
MSLGLGILEQRILVGAYGFHETHKRLPSSSELAVLLNVTKRAVRGHIVNAMRELERKGHLKRDGGQHWNSYGRFTETGLALARWLVNFPHHQILTPKQPRVRHPKNEIFLLAKTAYPKRVVDAPLHPGPDGLRVLKPGHYNDKLGGRVSKGRWAGMPIYALTLEERATCPKSCQRWLDCFGNGMYLAKRHRPGDRLETAVERDLQHLAKKHPGGFVVRLHVLGDFYEPGYVDFWATQLFTIPQLHVFGYTARHPEKEITGQKLQKLRDHLWPRFAIRFSGQPGPRNAGWYKKESDPIAPDAFRCPEQTGKTQTCATCGACWATDKRVVFKLH